MCRSLVCWRWPRGPWDGSGFMPERWWRWPVVAVGLVGVFVFEAAAAVWWACQQRRQP